MLILSISYRNRSRIHVNVDTKEADKLIYEIAIDLPRRECLIIRHDFNAKECTHSRSYTYIIISNDITEFELAGGLDTAKVRIYSTGYSDFSFRIAFDSGSDYRIYRDKILTLRALSEMYSSIV